MRDAGLDAILVGVEEEPVDADQDGEPQPCACQSPLVDLVSGFLVADADCRPAPAGPPDSISCALV
jgi:hypothetical protein